MNKKRVIESNEILRSAYQIAKRKGENTNWDAFKKILEDELVTQSSSIYGVSSIESATCTAKTFKLNYFEE